MSETWHSLYLRTADAPAVAAALIDSLQQHGYQRYDPFAGGSGTPPGLKTFIKQYVAPTADGWVRVLGDPDLAVFSDLSTRWALLHGWLSDSDSGIEVFANGAVIPDGLIAYLRPGKTADDLKRALQGAVPTTADRPASILPDDVQQLAQNRNVNAQQANRMIDRLTGQLFGKLDRQSGGEASAMQTQARALAMGGNRPDWNSAAGQRLKALASVLTLPANWREPDFIAVRDAYQAARMVRRNPNARLMPDEQAALKALPDAIAYEAVYMGRG
ncbi:MAG: hypothetical protein IT324_00680 [Anaerolineae bacterium]|nr:hypothetical protein [Anaerolineae bacterium]